MSAPCCPWKASRLHRRRHRRTLQRRHARHLKRATIRANRAAAHLLAPARQIAATGRTARFLPCPRSLNLSDDLVATVKFLQSIRSVSKGLKGRFVVDLRPLQEITPAGALLLVAEMDRWREITPGKTLTPFKPHQWNPAVRKRLSDMGFFRVLGTRCDVQDEPDDSADQYLPFISGHGSEGKAARQMRVSIESEGPKIAEGEVTLYDGLMEAMTNVRQHAYRIDEPVKRWWMSASVDVTGNRLKVMFLDHGAGIPATLPRSTGWEMIRGNLASLGFDALKDDGKLIEAAVTAGRSRTEEGHRGKGLHEDIRGYIESHNARGSLRILSNRGKYVYTKETGGREQTATSLLRAKLHGTFLEWTIEDYADDPA